MGCGSSRTDRAQQQQAQHAAHVPANAGTAVKGVDEEVDHNLGTYLATVLGVKAGITKDIQAYVAALRSEGCDMPEDFAGLEIEELKGEPFAFKRLHLKKVALWRANEEKGGVQEDADDTKPGAVTTAPQTPPPPAPPQAKSSRNIRGQCSVCDQDVCDTQPRLKDPSTGLYQHERCGAAAELDGGLAQHGPPPSNNQAIDAATSTEVHATATSSQVVADAKATAAAATEAEQTEVAAIMVAADAGEALHAAAANEAQAAAATAAKEAQAEVAAIMAAADAAGAEIIAEAKRQADAALAGAQADAAQITATAEAQAAMVHTIKTTASDNDNETVTRVAGFESSKPLLPDGKHAMLSYQWNVQEEVKQIEEMLKKRNVKCWMDIDGGMKNDIYDSMAEGVQDAVCLICFMTQAYQDSANCKLELKFAQQSGVPIIPVMMQPDFKAKGWLGILTSGSIWTPMHDRATVPDGVDNLIIQVQHVLHGSGDDADTHSEGSSEAGSAFDIGSWGAEISLFSLEETRDELERLRDEVAPLTSKRSSAVVGALCPLPAMVPPLLRGLYVTMEMQSVLDAVLSDTSPPQIGFCGMGGIGKTTVSCWVTRSDAVRTKFATVAWITLGQTPVLALCMDLLHMQLAGSAFPDSVAIDQKHEILKQAFLNKSVLLILDDCWDGAVAKHFNWIDQSTNSKILLSSRIRDVLDGGQIIDIAAPSKTDAVKMLLSTAGMDVEAFKSREEVGQIAKLCKRLPLTIGVAGKLIRQLSHGSNMLEASDWADVVTMLEEELNDLDGSMSIEESVIRVSIKAIPKKMQKHVSQLFTAFALVPEDTFVPLSVLGMVFDACSEPASAQKPLSRSQVRRYLKLLIDRSLVLGTVDRPQLHDVMLDYVQKQLAGEPYILAQRRLVESLRKSDRSRATPTGQYLQQCIKHHIKESYDASWERGEQAISWIEDHVSGVQDVVASSAASILPAEELAQEAEDAEMWWRASLRWNAVGLMTLAETGHLSESGAFVKRAVDASAKASVGVQQSKSDDGAGTLLTQYDLDSFDICALCMILKAWDPVDVGVYGERYALVCSTEAGQARPVVCFGAILATEWFPAFCTDQQTFINKSWKLIKFIFDLCDVNTDAYARSTEDDRDTLKSSPAVYFAFAGDGIINAPGFSWDCLANGDKLIEHYYCYVYERNHSKNQLIHGNDPHVYCSEALILTLQFGRVKDAKLLLDDQLIHLQKIANNTADAGYALTMMFTMLFASQAHYVLGLSEHVKTLFTIVGITFENAVETVDNISKPLQGALFTAMDHKGLDGGVLSLKRALWQLKAMCILQLDVDESKAIDWLQSLPDNDAYYAYSMTSPNQNPGGMGNLYHACYLALAHEKVGLLDGAIRFADLQLEPDMLKAGAPLTKSSQVIALACKGRVFAKLNRHDEALVAFQAAVTTSKQSYSLMGAFALRELANYIGAGEAAVQAGKDLEVKLDMFNDRMTRTEFDHLTIAP